MVLRLAAGLACLAVLVFATSALAEDEDPPAYVNIQPLGGIASNEGYSLGLEVTAGTVNRFSFATRVAALLPADGWLASAGLWVGDVGALSDVNVWASWSNAERRYFGVGGDTAVDDDPEIHRYGATRGGGGFRLGVPFAGRSQARFGYDLFGTTHDVPSGSLLAQQLNDGEAPPGARGSTTGRLVGGFLHDSRTERADPGDGSVFSLAVRTAQPFLGASYESYGVGAGAAIYLPLHKRIRVLLRGLADAQSDDAPLDVLDEFVETDRVVTGLGGPWALRGYPTRRFIGPYKTTGTVELRMLARTWIVDQHRWDVQIAWFFDAGSAFGPGLGGGVLRVTGGGGLRVILDRRHVLRADVAFAEEGAAVYLLTAQIR